MTELEIRSGFPLQSCSVYQVSSKMPEMGGKEK